MIGGKRASEGGVIADNVGGNVTIGLTFEQHQAALEAALKQKTKDLERAHKAKQKLIRLEMASLQSRLANIEADYEKTIAELADYKAKLARFENQIDPARKQAAFAELDKGKLTLAKALFEELAAQSRARALAHEQAKVDADIETAEFELALGEIAEQEVRWQEAFAHYEAATRLHPCYQHLKSAQKMAFHLANYTKAESLGRKSLTTAEEEFGKAAPEYGTALNNLAALLQATGRYEEAEKLYRQALENARVALGDDHPEFGIRLNNLAGLLEATGRFVEAEPLFRQAVAVLEKSLGPEHPNTKTIKANYEHFLTNHPPAD